MKKKKEGEIVFAVRTEESEEAKALRKEENLRIAEELRKNIAQGNADLVSFLGTDDKEIAKDALKKAEESFVGHLLCLVSCDKRRVVGRIREAMLMQTGRFVPHYVLSVDEAESGKVALYSFTLPEATELYRQRYLKCSEPYEGKWYEEMRIEDDKGRVV